MFQIKNKVTYNIRHIRLSYIPWSQSQLRPSGWLLQRMRLPQSMRRLLGPSKPSTQNPHCGPQTCRSSGDPQPDHTNPPPTCQRNIVNNFHRLKQIESHWIRTVYANSLIKQLINSHLGKHCTEKWSPYIYSVYSQHGDQGTAGYRGSCGPAYQQEVDDEHRQQWTKAKLKMCVAGKEPLHCIFQGPKHQSGHCKQKNICVPNVYLVGEVFFLQCNHLQILH